MQQAPHCYGRGSKTLAKNTIKLAKPLIREINKDESKLPRFIEHKIKKADSSCGIHAKIFEVDGYILKLSRTFKVPDPQLMPHLVPTVVYGLNYDRYLIIQKKILGCAAWRKNRKNRLWEKERIKRFRQWHNIVCWFARNSHFRIERCSKLSIPTDLRLYISEEEESMVFDDVHAENIGLDGNKIKVLDW